MEYNKKVILVIMDGWGIAPPDKFNAILNAKTPNLDRLTREFPNIRLKSDGLSVGLPDGQVGTSEINHQIIGSGRIILQDLPKIDNEIKTGTFFDNEKLVDACKHVNKNNSALHLCGILSDGKVHSSLDHIFALIDLTKKQDVKKLYLHVFTDGRDTPPKFTEKYFLMLDEHLRGTNYKISTIQGRFFLDRDRDWSKTKTAVDLIVKGKGMRVNNWKSVINYSYNLEKTDEFFEQFLLDEDGVVKNNDAFVFFHYRSDRVYQLTKEFLNRFIKNIYFVSFVECASEFKTHIAFPRIAVTHTLAEILSKNKKSQYHISETEKYTHLTYFLNGSRQEKFELEDWKNFKSTRFIKPNYNFEPSMRSFGITQDVIKHIENDDYDFIVINFPNTDMVGHTGNYEAAVIAAESVDFCIGKLFESIKNKLNKWSFIITSDHGNADIMWDYENCQPHTQHTNSPVPFIMVSDISCHLHARESLEDIAPTILDLMGLQKPLIMTGSSLIDPVKK